MKTIILVEPLYPRLGLLGGNPESTGKVSKLAALAAARKRTGSEKATAAVDAASKSDQTIDSTAELPSRPLSLLERLSANGKAKKPVRPQGPQGLNKDRHAETHVLSQRTSRSRQMRGESETAKTEGKEPAEPVEIRNIAEDKQVKLDMCARPSTFARTIVGEFAQPASAEPSHLHLHAVDVMSVYGQDSLAEVFDFAGPSPDDVVLKAQSSAKGLAIRRKLASVA